MSDSDKHIIAQMPETVQLQNALNAKETENQKLRYVANEQQKAIHMLSVSMEVIARDAFLGGIRATNEVFNGNLLSNLNDEEAWEGRSVVLASKKPEVLFQAWRQKMVEDLQNTQEKEGLDEEKPEEENFKPSGRLWVPGM